MNKLWQTSRLSMQHNAAVHAFTVGEDLIYDTVLLPYDIKGTQAHLLSLQEAGIIDHSEYSKLANELSSLMEASIQGKVTLPQDVEDCHTFIEQHLTEKLGELAMKVHSGRSRNDQVLTALRLYQIDNLVAIRAEVQQLILLFQDKVSEWNSYVMPGYSHGRQGMVITAGYWVESYVELLGLDVKSINEAIAYLDHSPLGAGAGFGNGLNLNREVSAKSMGFNAIQENGLACMASRGKDELKVLQALSQLMITIAKFATDILQYSSEHYGFVVLPDSMTTGSSMMPNKGNYDVMEILRANASSINGHVMEIAGIITGLGSGYHRDFQITKAPLMKGMQKTRASVKIMKEVIVNLQANSGLMEKAISKDTHMTQKALELVKKGTPFRRAYQQIKESKTV